MACNCSKKANVTGFGVSRRQQETQRAGAKPTPTAHTDPTGKRTEYGSRLEASAARRRRGGTISPI